MRARKGTVPGFVAASIYMSCRELKIPRTLREISEASNEEIEEVAKIFRLLLREFSLKMPIDEPFKLIPRIAAKTGVSWETTRLSIDILRKATENKVFWERTQEE
jgi:transcription initiation factor TFIIB